MQEYYCTLFKASYRPHRPHHTSCITPRSGPGYHNIHRARSCLLLVDTSTNGLFDHVKTRSTPHARFSEHKMKRIAKLCTLVRKRKDRCIKILDKKRDLTIKWAISAKLLPGETSSLASTEDPDVVAAIELVIQSSNKSDTGRRPRWPHDPSTSYSDYRSSFNSMVQGPKLLRLIGRLSTKIYGNSWNMHGTLSTESGNQILAS
jgi:hypothetical protein